MAPHPSCSALGKQCQDLSVTLRIGALDEGMESLDHESTWLLGHTDRISFSHLHPDSKSLLVDAVLHVRCRHLKAGQDPGSARCAALGHTGAMPVRTRGATQPRRLGQDQFRVVERQQLAELTLPLPARGRQLSVLDGINPCSIAPCSTADHTRGSACCRDLQVEILCRRDESELEALIRSRQSPYLCKITRENETTIDAEMISACGYLDEPGLNCTLHDRIRPDGRTAKPDLCSEWPDKGKGLHPGCIFLG
ncbi:MAG: hypothetical protein ABI587_18465 [Gemmatimonadales bacterium]